MLTLSNPDLLKQRCLIKDGWHDASTGDTIDVTNPFNGNTIGTIPSLTEQDIYHLKFQNQLLPLTKLMVVNIYFA